MVAAPEIRRRCSELCYRAWRRLVKKLAPQLTATTLCLGVPVVLARIEMGIPLVLLPANPSVIPCAPPPCSRAIPLVILNLRPTAVLRTPAVILSEGEESVPAHSQRLEEPDASLAHGTSAHGN